MTTKHADFKIEKKKIPQCLSVLQSCEILFGKLNRILVSGGHFPREGQIFGSSLMQTITIGQLSLSVCGLTASLHTSFWSSYAPQVLCFFPTIFRNSLPNECWPIPVPSYKNRPRWPKMLRECGYYCTYTHTQGPLYSSLVNDAPNLARSRNESKVSSHHHHHHHSSASS